MPQGLFKKYNIVVALLLVLAGTMLGGFLLLKGGSGSANISREIDHLLDNDNNNNDDDDNDGLKNWEEKIYRSDEKNPDTDGDGYLDGEEVASGYDPTKKAPGDELLDKSPKNPRPLPKNLTRALSMKLSQAVVEGKIKSFSKEGKPLSAEELEKETGIDSALEQAVSQQIDEFSFEKYSSEDIKITDKSGKTEAMAYLSAMGEALGKIASSEKTEMLVFEQALENGSYGKLEENRQAYFESYQRLKEISVPPDMVQFHKGLLGVLMVTNNIYLAVKNANDDPLKATIAIMQYRNVDQKTNELIKSLFEQIKEYN